MKRKIRFTNVKKSLKKQKINTATTPQVEEFDSFTKKLFQDNLSQTEKLVRDAFKMKDDIITGLKNALSQVKGELKYAELIIEERDYQIEQLQKEKSELMRFKNEKSYSETYQNKVDELKTDKQEMSIIISKHEKTIREYEEDKKHNETHRDDENVVLATKIEQLMRKYKDLKAKVKSRDLENFQKEQEKIEMTKHIETKDEIIKMKDLEISDLSKKFKEEQSKSFSFYSFQSRNGEMEKALEVKNIEIDKLKEQFNERKSNIDMMKKEHNNMIEEFKKRIQSKDELIKMKEAENIDIHTKLVEEQSRSSSIPKLKHRIKDIEEELKIKDIEKKNAAETITKENELLNEEHIRHEKQISVYVKELIVKETEIGNLKLEVSKKDKNIDLIKQQNENLKEECGKLEENLEAKYEVNKSNKAAINVLNKELKEARAKYSSFRRLENKNKDIEEAQNNQIKDTEMFNLENKLKEEQSKVDLLNTKTHDLEEKLKMKDLEIENIGLKITIENAIESTKTVVSNGELEKIIAEKDEEMVEMTKMFLEKDQKIKSVQISLEEVKEKFRLEFQNMVSEKDRLFANVHLQAMRALKSLKDEMQKQQESSNKIFEMKDIEILKLKSELKKNVDETTPTDSKLETEIKTPMAEPQIYSGKRLTDMLKALESNNCKLVHEVASLKMQLSMVGQNVVGKIDDVPCIEDGGGEMSNRKNEKMIDRSIDLTPDNSKSKPTLSMPPKLLEEVRRGGMIISKVL